MRKMQDDFVRNLTNLTLDQMVKQAMVIIECEGEEENVDNRALYRLQLDCVTAVGRMRFGKYDFDTAMEAAAG